MQNTGLKALLKRLIVSANVVFTFSCNPLIPTYEIQLAK